MEEEFEIGERLVETIAAATIVVGMDQEEGWENQVATHRRNFSPPRCSARSQRSSPGL